MPRCRAIRGNSVRRRRATPSAGARTRRATGRSAGPMLERRSCPRRSSKEEPPVGVPPPGPLGQLRICSRHTQSTSSTASCICFTATRTSSLSSTRVALAAQVLTEDFRGADCGLERIFSSRVRAACTSSGMRASARAVSSSRHAATTPGGCSPGKGALGCAKAAQCRCCSAAVLAASSPGVPGTGNSGGSGVGRGSARLRTYACCSTQERLGASSFASAGC
mmetsp:Transcript_16279/g.28431  ORF Transcript_16279/g.28431 Transcript_16279/m.28431 type:complete len:222 (-) Transcript_16279:578-1243(-)